MRSLSQQNKQRIKGVSELVGILILFGILIFAASQYQLTVVPDQEERTEIQHNITLQNQMVSLQSEIAGSANSNEVRNQQIQLGTTFESQIIFGIVPAVNAPAPAGQLQYEEQGNIVIDNATGQGGAAAYWTESGDAKTFSTGSFVYEPSYRRYSNAPNTVYENGIVYNEFESPTGDTDYVYQQEQTIINDRNISLIALDGDINTSSIGTRNVEAHPVSAPSTRISIESEESITIDIPTRLPEDEWENLLEDELDNGFVSSVSESGGILTITMDPDQTYTLALSRVYLTSRDDSTTIPSLDEEYISWQEDQFVVREQTRQSIDVQVKDEYDNPVSGVPIEAVARDQNGDCIGNFQNSDPDGTCETNVSQPGVGTSAERGQVTFIYETPQVDEDTDINVSINFDED